MPLALIHSPHPTLVCGLFRVPAVEAIKKTAGVLLNKVKRFFEEYLITFILAQSGYNKTSRRILHFCFEVRRVS